jgi:hypothetical protein
MEDSSNAFALMIPMVTGTALFVLIGWIVFVVVDGHRRREQQQALSAFHGKFLEKVGSTAEFGAFIQTEAGARFMKSLAIEGPSAKTHIVRATERGILCLFIGIVLMILGRSYPHLSEGLIIIGAIICACGVGNLFSSAASYALSKNLGLIEDTDHQETR